MRKAITRAWKLTDDSSKLAIFGTYALHEGWMPTNSELIYVLADRCTLQGNAGEWVNRAVRVILYSTYSETWKLGNAFCHFQLSTSGVYGCVISTSPSYSSAFTSAFT